MDLEGEYKPDPKRPSYVIFQEQLAEIEKNYDFIVFDCPPNVLRASQTASIAPARSTCPPIPTP